jgi:hypothetical protein
LSHFLSDALLQHLATPPLEASANILQGSISEVRLVSDVITIVATATCANAIGNSCHDWALADAAHERKEVLVAFGAFVTTVAGNQLNLRTCLDIGLFLSLSDLRLSSDHIRM